MSRLSKTFVFLFALASLAPAWVDKDDKWVASRKNWWAFQKPVRVPPPPLAHPWVKTPVDAFILEEIGRA